MAKKQKISTKIKKLSFSKFNWKNPKSFLALAFTVGFAAIGIYMVAFSSAATSVSSYVKQKTVSSVVANDGVKANVYCASTWANTAYGPVATCMQVKPGSTYSNMYLRQGYYSPLTKKFSAAGDWLRVPSTGRNDEGTIPTACKNMSYGFKSALANGNGIVGTAYGPVRYGQIYRYYGGKWQIKWANMNMLNRYCYPSGSWMNASPW